MLQPHAPTATLNPSGNTLLRPEQVKTVDVAEIEAATILLRSNAPFEKRVEQTVRWMLTGSRDADVVEAIQTLWPDQALQPLIAAAVEQLAKSAEFEPLVVRGWCFEATKDLYRRMVEIGDFAGALRAVKMLKDLAA